MRNVLDLLRGPHGSLIILAIVGVIVLVGVITAFAAGGGGDEENDGSEAVKGSVTAPGDSSDDEAVQA